jgi:cytochrome c-type biogenesis protein CcmF
MVALAIILPLGSLMPWKRARLDRVANQLFIPLMCAFAVAAMVWTLQTERTILAPIGIALGVWLVAGAKIDLWSRTGRGDLPSRLRRLANLPRADWGKSISHIGFGVTVIGISALNAWQSEDIRVAQVGETFEVGAYEITLADVRREPGPNYDSIMAEMVVTRNGRPVATLFPEKRNYPVAQMPTTEAAIDNGVLRDLYLVIGDPQDNGGWAVRTYIKPFANWIWAGAIIMALGGFVSLSDRRFRVAPGAARDRDETPVTPSPVAAE